MPYYVIETVLRATPRVVAFIDTVRASDFRPCGHEFGRGHMLLRSPDGLVASNPVPGVALEAGIRWRLRCSSATR